MKNTEHGQLLREMANYLTIPDIERGTIPARSSCLAIRARQAAEEIEGRREPTEKEILDLAYSLKDDQGALLVDLIGDGARRELREEDDIEWGAIAEERFLVATCRAILARFGGRAQPPREVPTLELVLKPIGDCWLQIKAPSGRQAAINLGPRGQWNDQTFIGSVILEVAELTRHLCEEGKS